MPIQKAPPPTLTSDGLTCFSPLSSEDVLTLVMSNWATTCSRDPIPSSLLQDISHNILPFLTTLINSSLSSGLQLLNTATVKSLLKKPTYRPVSLISFLSKTWYVLSTTNCPPIFQKTTFLTQISQTSGPITPMRRAPSRSPSVPPEPRPTRQSSFSSTSLLCLTVDHQILLSTLTEHC